MKEGEIKKPFRSLLFVCYGNTCRSPMAEGLAKKYLGEKVRVESAGLAPFFEGAAPEAIIVVRDLFDVDISQHRPRNVAGVPLDEFDYVIVLDADVYEGLRNRFPSVSEKMILWNIEDPFGQDRDAYEKSVRKIQENIIKYLVPLIT